MGLDITSLAYHGWAIKSAKFGSYGRIHILRQWVVTELDGLDAPTVDAIYTDENMSKTTYPALVCHNDSEGGYISATQAGIAGFANPIEWDDLDALQQEMRRLDAVKGRMPEQVRAAFDFLASFVLPADEDETTPFMVVFH